MKFFLSDSLKKCLTAECIGITTKYQRIIMSKRSIYHMIMPFTCILSILALPLQASAYDYDDRCCDTGCGSVWKDLAIFTGAAAAGVAAGVIAGNSSGSKGHRGSQGATGPQGPQGIQGIQGEQGPPGLGFTPAPEGTTVTFTEALVVAVPIVAGTLTPFVETPDGRTLLGTPITAPAIVTGALPPITDTEPVFGTYHFGFVLSSGFVTTGLTATTLITTTRAGANPTTQFINVSLAIAATQTQAIEEFAFGDVPPVP